MKKTYKNITLIISKINKGVIYICLKKKDKWTPDVIAGYIESHQLYLKEGFTSISTTTIYRVIHYHLLNSTKDDLRVIKTKNVLFNSLVLLMKDKTFEEIKVSDICKKALINRSTFYSHYNDKYELLVDFINVLKEEFVNELNSNNENLNTREFFINLIGLFLNHIESKKDVYSSIMINNKNGIMIDILLSVVIDDMLKKINLCRK